MGNSFGKIFKLTTFGESHGVAIGGVIDGCPAGLKVDFNFIQAELDRRKPGQSNISTQRKESDIVEFLSGIFEGLTTGTPIGFLIKNKDHKSEDYNSLKDLYRPSHADYTYQEKYGVRDYRGGGRSSARETACRVVAGALAKQILKTKGVFVGAYVKSVGKITIKNPILFSDISQSENSIVRCPDKETSSKMEELIVAAKDAGDSLGGVIHGVIHGVMPGLGEPVFEKFNAALAHALMGINAVKGFEIGSGFSGAEMFGSEQNDSFTLVNDQVSTDTNNSGGIQGGLTNGQDVTFNVAFKPVATIAQKQETVSMDLKEVKMEAKGRHDPCIVPRAVPIVEAMAALVTLDFLLRSKTDKLSYI